MLFEKQCNYLIVHETVPTIETDGIGQAGRHQDGIIPLSSSPPLLLPPPLPHLLPLPLPLLLPLPDYPNLLLDQRLAAEGSQLEKWI